MNYNFNDPSISDLEFAKRLIEAQKQAMDGMTPDDFDVDPVQMQKLNNLVEFFRKAAKDLDGKIVSVDLNPLNPPNGVTTRFIVFDLFGEDIQRFCDVVGNCSAISIDVTDSDEIEISCTIPNVFVQK